MTSFRNAKEFNAVDEECSLAIYTKLDMRPD